MLKMKYPFAMSVLSMAMGASSAYAASDSMPLQITIPNLKPGYEVNFSALYVKPGASNLNYAILNNELPTQSPSWHEQELRPAYTPAFEIGVRYIFSNSGEDVNLDWTHLYSTTSSSVVAPSASYFVGPDWEIGPPGLITRSATGKVNFKYDVINFDFGQYVDFGSHVETRFFGGISTGFLREELYPSFFGNAAGGAFRVDEDINSSFTGIGPRFGMDTHVDIRNGFGIMGEGALSALVGSMNQKTTYTSSGPLLLSLFGQYVNKQEITDQSNTQVIPGFDAKLGVTYTHPFYSQGMLTCTLGYQYAVYWDAISEYTPQTLVTPMSTGGIFVGTMAHRLSNYSVQGPFLNFALKL